MAFHTYDEITSRATACYLCSSYNIHVIIIIYKQYNGERYITQTVLEHLFFTDEDFSINYSILVIITVKRVKLRIFCSLSVNIFPNMF